MTALANIDVHPEIGLVHSGRTTRMAFQAALHIHNLLRRRGTHIPVEDILARSHLLKAAPGSATIAQAAKASDASGDAIRKFIPRNILATLSVHIIGLNKGVLSYASIDVLTPAAEAHLLNAVQSTGIFDVTKVVREAWDRRTVQQMLRERTMTAGDTLPKAIAELIQNPEDTSPVPDILSGIFQEALDVRASDIHVDSSNTLERCWIAYRIDGDLEYRHLLTPEAMKPLATLIKGQANIDAIDVQKPQDGNMSVKWQGRTIDCRVATVPVEGGEKITIRLLDSASLVPLQILLQEDPILLDRLTRILESPMKRGGKIVISGPTGSGKSTTMYALLVAMPRMRKNIMTAESPVEYKVGFVRQVPVFDTPTRNFAATVRSFLRHDPDAIIIGEMRDPETVEAACRAAESGHLVVTTVHANNAVQSMDRLLGLLPNAYRANGISVLSDSLEAVLNQRLVKRVCQSCATRIKAAEAVMKYGINTGAIDGFDPHDEYLEASEQGCPNCRHTGYNTRTLVPEYIILPENRKQRSLVAAALREGRLQDIPNIPGCIYQSRTRFASTLLRKQLIDPIHFKHLLDETSQQTGEAEPSAHARSDAA
jgi:type II secretory ATPase GspE/PulE/Tfp pilus assembly ATPase PilB-like protein